MVVKPNVRKPVLAVLAAAALAFFARGTAAEGEAPAYTVAGNGAQPYLFSDEVGSPQGLVVDLLEEMARQSGMRFRYVVSTWKDVLAAIEAGGVDIVAGLVPTPERRQSFDFTAPFAIFPFALFVRKDGGITDQSQLAGKTIAVQQGSLSYGYVRDSWPHVRMIAIEDAVDALRGVASSRIDAAVLPRLLADRILHQERISGVAALEQDVFVSALSFAVAKGREDLVKRLDEALAVIKASGSYEAIHYRWNQVPPEDDAAGTLGPYVLGAFAVLLALLAAGFAWSWSLRRQVERKTRQLEAEAAQTRLLEEMIDRGPIVASLHRAEAGFPCEYISRNAARLGFDRQSFLDGRPLLLDVVDPRDRPVVESVLERHIAYGPDDFVVEGRLVSGRLAESTVHIGRDAAGGALYLESLAMDVTDKRKADRILRESIERARASFDLSPDGIIIVRAADSTIVEANPGFQILSGWPREGTVGRTVADLGLWADAEEWLALESYLRHNGAARNREAILRTRTNVQRTGLVHAAVATIDGHPHYLVIIRDITELRHARDELRRARDELEMRVSERTRELEREILERQYAEKALQEANDFLEHRVAQRTRELETEVAERRRAERTAAQANQAKTEFLANVSHELRTPLNSIIGFSDILAAQLFGPVGHEDYVEYARDINEAGKHLLAIINDILDVSRLEIGTAVLDETRLDVRHVVRSCRRLAEERASAKNIRLLAEAGSSLPALRADERRVKQILLNLLSNAIKFTPEGGRVELSANLGIDGGFTFEVKDTGIGIAPDKMKVVMSTFGQADGSLARRFDGVGLGLPLSARLARAHGGSLTLSSTVGKGTTVQVHFPPARSVWIEAEAGVVA